MTLNMRSPIKLGLFLGLFLVFGHTLYAQQDLLSYRFKGTDLVVSIDRTQPISVQDSVLKTMGTSLGELLKDKSNLTKTINTEGWRVVLISQPKLNWLNP